MPANAVRNTRHRTGIKQFVGVAAWSGAATRSRRLAHPDRPTFARVLGGNPPATLHGAAGEQHRRNDRKREPTVKRVIVSIGVAMALAVGLFAWAASGGPIASHLPAAPTAALASTVTTAGAPATPGPSVCGDTTTLNGPSTAPAGAVTVPAGTDASFVGALQPSTTYFLAAGMHTLGTGAFDQFQPADDDVFIGAPGAVVSGQGVNDYAFVSNATGVEIEYLTIEDFVAPQSEGVVNQDSGTAWTIRNDTVEDNPHGAGVMLGSDDVLTDSCLTENGQYGFQSYSATGPRTVTVTDNEISDNDTANYTAPQWAAAAPAAPSSGRRPGRRSPATMCTTMHLSGSGPTPTIPASTFPTITSPTTTARRSPTRSATTRRSPTTRSSGTRSASARPIRASPRAPSTSPSPGAIPGYPAGMAQRSSISGNVFTDNWSGVVLWENANRYCGSAANTSTGACTLVDPSCLHRHIVQRERPDQHTAREPRLLRRLSLEDAERRRDRQHIQLLAGRHRVVVHRGQQLRSQRDLLPVRHISAVPRLGRPRRHLERPEQPLRATTGTPGRGTSWRSRRDPCVSWAQWSSGIADASASGDPFGAQDAGSTYDGSAAPPSTTTTTRRHRQPPPRRRPLRHPRPRRRPPRHRRPPRRRNRHRRPPRPLPRDDDHGHGTPRPSTTTTTTTTTAPPTTNDDDDRSAVEPAVEGDDRTKAPTADGGTALRPATPAVVVVLLAMVAVVLRERPVAERMT